MHNILPVTLGNFLGGGILLGFAQFVTFDDGAGILLESARKRPSWLAGAGGGGEGGSGGASETLLGSKHIN